MFNNLIESSSHTRELKRRGSFVLFTAVTYFMLFVMAGVASIYAYDAHLEDPTTEIIVMLPPMDMVAPEPVAPVRNSAPPRGSSDRQNISIRENPTASVNVPQVVPTTTSANPNPILPVPDDGIWERGRRDSDPGGSLGSRTSGAGGVNEPPSRTTVIEAEPPLPQPTPRPVPSVVTRGVINGQAISLPKPAYPAPARQAKIHGVVSVQVLIDERGKVISAKTISGNPLLAGVAQQAALNARFSPTKLGDQPVKVSGVITYNFVLQ